MCVNRLTCLLVKAMGNAAGDSAYCSDSGKFFSSCSDRAGDHIWKACVCPSCSRLYQKLCFAETHGWNLLIKNVLVSSTAGRIVGFADPFPLLPMSKLLSLVLGSPQSWEFPRSSKCCCCSGMCAECSDIKGTVWALTEADRMTEKHTLSKHWSRTLWSMGSLKEPAIHLAMVSSFVHFISCSGSQAKSCRLFYTISFYVLWELIY